MSAPRTIDVHAHYLPESYRAALLDHGHGQPDGFPQIAAWSAEEHVAVMDRLGIATSLLSISSLACTSPAKQTLGTAPAR